MRSSFDIDKFISDNELTIFSSVDGRPVASDSILGNSWVFDKDKPERFPSSLVESEGRRLKRAEFDAKISSLPSKNPFLAALTKSP